MNIKMMNPYELKDNERNYRKHPVNQLNAIRGSIEEFGWLEPIIYNERTERLLNGHARVYIARRDKLGDVPVHVVNVDEEAEKRILVSLQRTNDLGLVDEPRLQALLAEVCQDSDLPLPGWDELQLQAMLAAEEPTPARKKFDLNDMEFSLPKRRGKIRDNVPVSRIIHIYLTDEMDTKFRGWIDEVSEMFDTSTITDTVIKCVEHCLLEWNNSTDENNHSKKRD